MALLSLSVLDSGERISRSARITLNARIDEVFPLFGPIREKEWADGWDPEIIYSNGESVSKYMVFRTKGRAESEPFYLWTITTFDPEDHKIEYTVSTQNRVWFISVSCVEAEEMTQASISYTFTSLNEEGKTLNRDALHRMFATGLRDWEHAINHYLKTGNILKAH